MKNKQVSVLKANVRELPYHIVGWQRRGHAEQEARAKKIYHESAAELRRRGFYVKESSL